MEQNKELYKALEKFYALSKPIVKDSKNPFFKSKYCSLDMIQEAIKPWLKEAGLIVIQGIDETGKMKSTVIHVNSGESIYAYFPIVVVKSDAQGYGSANSYAKRYSLTGLLNLTIADEDDDANKASYVGNPDVKELPSLSDEGLRQALDRISKGEADLYQKVVSSYHLTPDQKSKIDKVKKDSIHEV